MRLVRQRAWTRERETIATTVSDRPDELWQSAVLAMQPGDTVTFEPAAVTVASRLA